ncbi:hypothetical protein AGMMS50212_05770 [Spirochaetia bacterium]|nr:hypothetical protein AGMMS50212_05770 [Spirochaetia bacterium]
MRQLDHYETIEKMPKLNIDCVLFICDISCENLGLILRSADIFGVKAVYYQQGISDATKKISKLSRNSRIPVYFENGISSLLNLKDNGYHIIALEITDTSKPLKFVSFQQKTCLVIGNEQNGIPDNILNLADYSCHIEMIGGHISSLNVSVAASIALYEMAQYHLNINLKK